MEAPGLPRFYAPLVVDVLLDPFYVVEWQLIGMKVMRVMHPPRPMVQRPPVWELLDQAGVATGVVRFDFTYPAAARHGLVVSNHVGRDNWTFVRAQPGVGEASVSPPGLANDLLAPFAEDRPFDEALLDAILPSADRVGNPFDLAILRNAIDIDDRSFEAALAMLRARPDLPFLALYLSGLDEVCHGFWEYRFPEAYGASAPPAEDVARLGKVIDRYLQFLDGRLARLVAAFPTPPNVVIVSDHGHEAVLDHPVWRGWHSAIGVFIAGGPDVGRRSGRLGVSYYDVVPTVVDLLGFAPPAGAHGESLRR
jgi:predicted AlkP superfamily phosphohydrolase/phosphomutase